MTYLVTRTGFEPVSAETDINLGFYNSDTNPFTPFIPSFLLIQNILNLKNRYVLLIRISTSIQATFLYLILKQKTLTPLLLFQKQNLI
ncbi:hypothetical protein B0A78_02940 [Flavobacterium columnare NBRC 100251 = ATCC 23463]|uniref:hypothetical protein n=1 Tax=Flavobacterium columnare TaxID=996 RepID=UPI00059D5EB3|nr:hypothetical protein [Flavobacterium columnare]PDS25978.1 hypothetical protein B0A78_02940 [Flavobacterium columnare NBRC 100251 = ATCC 23463]APT21789.1 hypothetical protein BU993_03540 [Flavobacterium columnare]AUX19037.1 hypothetical protein AQ623_12680 [Flavobacterium columnare]MBF6651398.1 hypothetical protein [Flavobacterium columnare]MBF6655245.1 hypothetical protein [Flavobacterium columnare]